MALFKTLILCAVVSLAAGRAWKPCAGKKMTATIAKVDVKGCDPGATICDLKKGTNASVTVTFTTTDVETQAKADVTGFIKGIPIPFPVGNSDACVYKPSGLTPCPLKANKQYVYTHLVEVKSVYPKIEVLVLWDLKGSSESIMCFALNAQIVD